MAAALGSWLKEVVVVLMLATLVDLLLPGQTMRPYVRTVLGLVVLFTLVSPLFRLFSSGWDERMLFGQPKMQAIAGTSAPASVPPFRAIVREGERFARWREGEARRLAEQRAAEAVREHIETRFPEAEVAAVSVELNEKGDGGVAVGRVEIAWRLRDRAPAVDGEAKPSSATRVELSPVPAVSPVEPVGRPQPTTRPAPQIDGRERRSADIAEAVAEFLDIPATDVVVRYTDKSPATFSAGR